MWLLVKKLETRLNFWSSSAVVVVSSYFGSAFFLIPFREAQDLKSVASYFFSIVRAWTNSEDDAVMALELYKMEFDAVPTLVDSDGATVWELHSITHGHASVIRVTPSGTKLPRIITRDQLLYLALGVAEDNA